MANDLIEGGAIPARISAVWSFGSLPEARHVGILVLCLLLASFGLPTTTPLYATSPAGDSPALVGVVRDSAGRPLANAQVVIAGLSRNVTTNSQGQFAFRALPPGTYDVSSKAVGYATAQVEVVIPWSGPDVKVTFTMPASSLTPSTIEANLSRSAMVPSPLRHQAGASDSVPPQNAVASTLRLGANMDLVAMYQERGGTELLLREAEVAAESQVSPRVHAFVFLTRPSGEPFDIEEAAATVDLPGGFRLRAGRYRVEFGYLNTVHEPERPEVTIPLPVAEFLTDEQLREVAVTVGRIINLGVRHRVAVSTAVWDGDNQVAFADERSGRTKPVAAKLYYGFESPSLAYQLGASGVTQGRTADGHGGTSLQAIDARLLIEPEYNAGFDYSARFGLTGELLFSSQRDTSAAAGFPMTRAMGAWVAADYQLLRRHHVGLGAEYAQGRLDRRTTVRAYSARYTWYQTPHARMQIQGRYLDRATDMTPRGWQINLQWNVVLGPHSERPFLPIMQSDVERLGPP